jgi:hypothetical protein
MAKKFIQKAIKHPGALHRQLGVAEGEKIPASKMAAARAGKYGPLAEKRAHFAKTLASFEEGGVVPKTGAYKLHEGERVIPASKGKSNPGPMQEKVEQTSETHPGNLNKSQQPAPDRREGTFGVKSNNETATLRSGNLPKVEAVKEVDHDANKGAAVKAALRQNQSDEKGEDGCNVVPSGKDYPTVVSSGN